MTEIDIMVRKIVRRHINANIPTEVFYTHWKDGGFSLTPLHERARMLRIKTFMSMYNSPNEKTKFIMREFTDRERRHRGIKIRVPGANSEPNDHIFLNWKINGSIRKGTDTIVMKAKEACDYFNITMKFVDENVLALSVQTFRLGKNGIKHRKDQRTRDEIEQEEQEIIDDANQTVQDNTIQLNEEEDTVKLSSKVKAQLKVGNMTCTLNDNITTWIVKARTNMLINGNMCSRNHIHVHGQMPRCPYCGEVRNDTLEHRLNSCPMNRFNMKKRHNMVQNIILKELVKKFGHRRVTIDHGVNINGQQVAAPYNTLKPDIVAYDDHRIHIIEFSCPYDHLKEDGTETMEKTYQDKVNKYKDLVVHCRQQFNMEADLSVIIVSSLGAVHSKSIKEIKKLLDLKGKSQKRKVNSLLKRMSIASCIGSFFIYYNMNFREEDRHRGLNDEETPEPSQQDPHRDAEEAHSSPADEDDEEAEHAEIADHAEDMDDEVAAEEAEDSDDNFVHPGEYRNNEPRIILPEDESIDAEITVPEEIQQRVRLPAFIPIIVHRPTTHKRRRHHRQSTHGTQSSVTPDAAEGGCPVVGHLHHTLSSTASSSLMSESSSQSLGGNE